MIMVGRQSIALHDLTHENGNERCNDDTWCIMIVINLLTIVCMNVWTFCTVGKLHLFQVCLKCHFALFIIQQYPYFVSWSEQIRHYCYFLTKFHYNEKSRSRALEQLTSKFVRIARIMIGRLGWWSDAVEVYVRTYVLIRCCKNEGMYIDVSHTSSCSSWGFLQKSFPCMCMHIFELLNLIRWNYLGQS